MPPYLHCYFHRNHCGPWPRNLYTKHTLHGSMTWLFGEEMEDNKCEKKISSWCDSTHWHKTQGLRRHWSLFLGALVGRADILSLKASRTKLMEFPTKEPASFDSLLKPYVSVVGLAIKGQSWYWAATICWWSSHIRSAQYRISTSIVYV